MYLYDQNYDLMYLISRAIHMTAHLFHRPIQYFNSSSLKARLELPEAHSFMSALILWL
uniref:Uncharacterized protein n=1 Tax=Anguilla anguilla TaxID=7936 RepID=A0A0E9UZ15_ANGAN